MIGNGHRDRVAVALELHDDMAAALADFHETVGREQSTNLAPAHDAQLNLSPPQFA